MPFIFPLSTTFPGSALPPDMLPYPNPPLPGSGANVGGNQLRIFIDPKTADMVLSKSAPRVLIPLDDVDSDFFLAFRFTFIPTDASGKSTCGVGLCDLAKPLSDFQPLIEFGKQGLFPVYASSNTDIVGGVSATAQPLTGSPPWWLRIVRADNVMYAEWALSVPSTPHDPPLTGWHRFDDSATRGSIRRSGTQPNAIMLFARAADATATNSGIDFLIADLFLYRWARYSSAVQIGDLKATTWPGGGRIDLDWTLPTGPESPKAMSIWRSRYGHPEFKPPRTLTPPPEGVGLTGFGEEIYRGPPIQHWTDGPDTFVREGEFIYYSVFVSRAPYADPFPLNKGTLLEFANDPGDTDWGPQIPPANKVTGLSINKTYERRGGWFYRLFPEKYREDDAQEAANLGTSNGLLERYSLFLQSGIDLMEGLLAGFGKLNDTEFAPLGLVGLSVDQTSIVDGFLRDFDIIPNAPGLDARGKRRLWQFGLNCLKQKGSVEGCCRWVKLITGWENAVCIEPGVRLNLRWLRTWDGFTTRNDFASANITYAPGKMSGLVLPPNRFKGGLYVDWFGDVRPIADNSTTELFFEDQTYQPWREVIIQGRGSLFTFLIDAVLAGPNRPPNDYAWDRGSAWATSTTFAGRAKIARTYYGAFGTAALDPIGVVGPQTVSIAYNHLDGGGGSFANRKPVHRFWLFTGEPSWLLHPASDVSLIGSATDPFYRLWPGINPIGSGKSYPMTDFDFLVYAPPGAAKVANLPTTFVTSSSITLKGGPGFPTISPGDYINPNRNQEHWFRIAGSTAIAGATVYFIEPDNDITPDQCAAPGDLATIAPRITVEHDRNLRVLMPLMLPFDSRLFIYYQ
jgi:hypothetical protein